MTFDVFARKDILDRGEHDFDIGGKRYVVNIPHVEFEFLGPRQRVAPMALRPAADAWTNLVTTRLLRAVERQILNQQRSRAYQAHVALEHVPQLRQLVEAAVAHKPPQPRYPQLVRQKIALRVAPVVHGPELQNPENLAVLAGPLLPEKHPCPLISNSQSNRNQSQHWTKHQQTSARSPHVNHSLKKTPIHAHNINQKSILKSTLVELCLTL